jgi:pimeloyl-ACP methyl ester carboxylesterase
MRNVSRLVAWVAAALLAAVPASAADTPDLRCEQEPGTRFFWIEWGFCDLEPHGPDHARGVVIWNHGILGTSEQFTAPPAAALRLLHARGWDIVKINRHNLAENARSSLVRATERTAAEIQAQRARGYRRVVLAGQSFGGLVSLEAAGSTRDVYAVIALAPGVTGAPDRLDPERLLQDVKAPRIAVVFPQGDALFDRVRGPVALRALSRRGDAFLLVDEASPAISGHIGAMGGRFALRYGLCLADFLSDAPPGRFLCPEGREGEAARELLGRRTEPGVQPMEDSGAVPPGLTPFLGLWYGLLEETVIVTGIVRDDGSVPRLLYRAASGRATSGVYPVQIETGRLHATLSATGGRAPSLTLSARAPGALDMVWTSLDGQRTMRGRLAPLGPAAAGQLAAPGPN